MIFVSDFGCKMASQSVAPVILFIEGSLRYPLNNIHQTDLCEIQNARMKGGGIKFPQFERPTGG